PLITVKENLAKINHHGQRAERIVGGMLVHTQVRSAGHALADVNKILAESVYLSYHSFRARYPGSRVDLRLDYDARIGPIQVEAADLQRVFVNIVDNALYSTVRKQGSQGVVHSPTLRVTTKELDGAAEIRIRDNGAGVSKGDASRLFTPFFTTKPPEEGVGLGL